MIDQLGLLTSRRGYEFGADEIRLSVISTKPVQEAIQRAFNFQIAQVATPMAVFGEVAGTIPPGLVFDYGVWISPEGSAVPIRYLHFEPQRIVIDVAGPSSTITPIYELIRRITEEAAGIFNAEPKRPVLGEPHRLLNYSEITFKGSWPLERLFPRRVWDLFRRASGIDGTDNQLMAVPNILVQSQPNNRESLGGIANPDSTVVQFAPRLGTKLSDQVYFSAALLDSDAHIEYLEELDKVLSAK